MHEDPEVLAEWQRMWDESGGPLFPDADKRAVTSTSLTSTHHWAQR